MSFYRNQIPISEQAWMESVMDQMGLSRKPPMQVEMTVDASKVTSTWKGRTLDHDFSVGGKEFKASVTLYAYDLSNLKLGINKSKIVPLADVSLQNVEGDYEGTGGYDITGESGSEATEVYGNMISTVAKAFETNNSIVGVRYVPWSMLMAPLYDKMVSRFLETKGYSRVHAKPDIFLKDSLISSLQAEFPEMASKSADHVEKNNRYLKAVKWWKVLLRNVSSGWIGKIVSLGGIPAMVEKVGVDLNIVVLVEDRSSAIPRLTRKFIGIENYDSLTDGSHFGRRDLYGIVDLAKEKSSLKTLPNLGQTMTPPPFPPELGKPEDYEE